jgi:hypothetical protein
MRWGVRDEMTNEHMTTALCMNELRQDTIERKDTVYRKGIILYRVSEFLSSRLNHVLPLPPPPPACECVLPTHLGPGGTHSLAGEGERGPNSDDRKSGLCLV